MRYLHIQRAPLGVSLQDGGRKGYLRYGVSEAGAMDWARHAMVNRMLDKPATETAIEVGPAGLGMVLESGRLQISFAGPGFKLRYHGEEMSGPRRLVLEEGQPLEVVPRSGAMWAYIGIQGQPGIDRVLGSHAENRVGDIRALRLETGTRLPVIDTPCRYPEMQSYVDPYIAYETQAIGIMPASQYGDFSQEMRDGLVSQPLSVASRFDRMAYQLKGVLLRCASGHDILSDAVTLGAIQVPGDGRPFVLMADHQPTGGYPKIACICKADLPRLAQMSPGRPFMMRWISTEQALQKWAARKAQIGSLMALRGY